MPGYWLVSPYPVYNDILLDLLKFDAACLLKKVLPKNYKLYSWTSFQLDWSVEGNQLSVSANKKTVLSATGYLDCMSRLAPNTCPAFCVQATLQLGYYLRYTCKQTAVAKLFVWSGKWQNATFKCLRWYVLGNNFHQMSPVNNPH